MKTKICVKDHRHPWIGFLKAEIWPNAIFVHLEITFSYWNKEGYYKPSILLIGIFKLQRTRKVKDPYSDRFILKFNWNEGQSMKKSYGMTVVLHQHGWFICFFHSIEKRGTTIIVKVIKKTPTIYIYVHMHNIYKAAIIESKNNTKTWRPSSTAFYN